MYFPAAVPGALLMTPDFSLVIVEGCNKATKRYAKLMLRRIDWAAPPPVKADQDGKVDDNDMEEDEDEREPNRCDLVSTPPALPFWTVCEAVGGIYCDWTGSG